MLFEKSAGFIIFRIEKNQRKYLLLYKKPSGIYKERWSFPKGIIEKGEDELKAAIRETKEETGIKNFKQIKNFKEKAHYIYKKENDLVSKDVAYFLAKTRQKKAILDFEHSDYIWLPYREALEKLTFKTDKNVLKKAEKFLKNLRY
ncbi:MAG: NUDIX domain-containing protein [Candidatus Nanoarchaeia archaeon]